MLISYCIENVFYVGNRRNQYSTLSLTLLSFIFGVASASTFTLPSSCGPPALVADHT